MFWNLANELVAISNCINESLWLIISISARHHSWIVVPDQFMAPTFLALTITYYWPTYCIKGIEAISGLWWWNLCEIRLSGDVEDHLLAGGRLPPLLCQQALITVAFCCISNNFIMLPLTLGYALQHWQFVRVWLPITELLGFFFLPLARTLLLSHTLKP